MTMSKSTVGMVTTEPDKADDRALKFVSDLSVDTFSYES